MPPLCFFSFRSLLFLLSVGNDYGGCNDDDDVDDRQTACSTTIEFLRIRIHGRITKNPSTATQYHIEISMVRKLEDWRIECM